MASDQNEPDPRRDPGSLARSVSRETPVRNAMKRAAGKASRGETGVYSAPDVRFLGFMWDEAERPSRTDVGDE